MDLLGKLIAGIKAALGIALVEHIDHLALYPATVKAAAADGSTVDVVPLDGRLEPHQGVPLRQVAGCTVVVKAGAIVLVGWEAGDPSAMYALPTFYSGAGVSSVAWIADLVTLGATSGADFVALAAKVLTQLQNLQAHFTAVEAVLTGAPINEPGNGAPSALQTALKAAIGASPYPAPASVAAAQVKAK